MAKTNFPNTSFMNLFKNIIYDKDQNPNPSLDIWDAWVIPLFNNVEDPFLIKDQDIFSQNITQLKILSRNNIDQILFRARREKIINDSNVDKDS